MIARAPEFAHALAHGFDGSVDAGAPLTVADGEVAVLAQFGTITRVIGPGSYQVPAEFGGAGVEAWFVSTRPFADVKFGGPINVGGVKAVFGSCGLQVVAAERLVASLVGQRPDVGEGIVNAVRAELIKAAKSSAMEGGVSAAEVRAACTRAAASVRDTMGIAVEISAMTVQ